PRCGMGLPRSSLQDEMIATASLTPNFTASCSRADGLDPAIELASHSPGGPHRRRRARKENTMKVFVAGASGAIGTRLVPQLIERGHEVIGTSRTHGRAERIAALGARAIVLDLLDAPAVRKAVLESEPDAIVNQATALADVTFSKNLDRSFAQTKRLRREGTDALLAAAREAGVSRFVAQSYASTRYARAGGWIKGEDDPLDPDPVEGMRETAAAMTHLDEAVIGVGGIALRYGGFYGADHDALGWPRRQAPFPVVRPRAGVPPVLPPP